MKRRVQHMAVTALLASSSVFIGATPTSGTSASGGQVLRVPHDYPTIQAAVDAAAEGDLVLVQAGRYNENVVVSTSDLRIHADAGAVVDGTGLTGIGIYVRGVSAAAPVSGVEVSNFEVRNFERGIIVQWASNVRLHRNDVHDNVDKTDPIVLGDAAGIELITTHFTDVSHNIVRHNGEGGIQLRVGSTQNTIHHNRINENGTGRLIDFEGRGIMVTGAGTHDNRIEHNEILGNYGRGVMISRPAGTAPVTGNVVAHNRLHANYRSGVSIMFAATGNFVVYNDARDNNLSGLAPCYRCNLFDLSIGGNVWEKNLGTFNGTDACTP
jgi:hypothetical protein